MRLIWFPTRTRSAVSPACASIRRQPRPTARNRRSSRTGKWPTYSHRPSTPGSSLPAVARFDFQCHAPASSGMALSRWCVIINTAALPRTASNSARCQIKATEIDGDRHDGRRWGHLFSPPIYTGGRIQPSPMKPFGEDRPSLSTIVHVDRRLPIAVVMAPYGRFR